MRLFVVRHVKAGSRSDWNGDDEARPASKSGRRQAAAIARRLAPEQVSALVSSPFLRCRQSLEPLGELTGLAIVDDDRLREGATLDETLAVVVESPDRAVLCSHGDVIPDLIKGLVRRGMELTGEPDWRKATIWVLVDARDAGTPDDDQLFTTATVEPPPPKHR